jgi:hypothetical protein
VCVQVLTEAFSPLLQQPPTHRGEAFSDRGEALSDPTKTLYNPIKKPLNPTHKPKPKERHPMSTQFIHSTHRNYLPTEETQAYDWLINFKTELPRFTNAFNLPASQVQAGLTHEK